MSGGSTAAPTTDQVLAVWVAVVPAKIRMVACATTGGSGGASATIVDVRKNGVSVYKNLASRPTLPAGQTGVFVTYPPDVSNVRRGDVLTLVCAQAGVNAPVAATVAIEEP
jgi:hypothetical protein